MSNGLENTGWWPLTYRDKELEWTATHALGVDAGTSPQNKKGYVRQDVTPLLT